MNSSPEIQDGNISFVPETKQQEDSNSPNSVGKLFAKTSRLMARVGLAGAITATAISIAETSSIGEHQPLNAAEAAEASYPWNQSGFTDLSPILGPYSWGYKNCLTGMNCGVSTVMNGTRYYYRDGFGYDIKNCTSYVAWKVNKEFGANVSGWGNATNWDNNAIGRFTVDTTPEAGDIAVWEGGYGHVAFVESVNGDGSVNISQYNRAGNGTFSTETRRADKYIDINGTGRAWGQAAANGVYPDGTFLKINESGAIYRMVGGAPVRQFNQGAIPDFRGTATNISHTDLGKMPTAPRDGAVMSIAEAGGSGIYRFVGGAPIRQFNWGAIPDFSSEPVISVNYESLAKHDHMLARPRNGSFMSIAEAGGSGVYEFVGGAPIRQYNWGALPGFRSAVSVNFQSLVNLDHMNQYPTDGSVVSIAEAGGAGLYKFVGGAPMRLYNWGPLPGFNGGDVTNINFESLVKLDHMRPTPSNGEFIASHETGAVYRVAGGAALRLYNHGSIPGFGSQGVDWVNQQTIDTKDHLAALPADGTVLQGVNSKTNWKISNGKRTQVPDPGNAVIVDEQTIETFVIG